MGHHYWDKSKHEKIPRLEVVPDAVVERISEGGQTPNEMRVWLEETMRTNVNLPKGRLGFVLRIYNGRGVDLPK